MINITNCCVDVLACLGHSGDLSFFTLYELFVSFASSFAFWCNWV